MTSAGAGRAVDRGRELSDPATDAMGRPNVLVAYASEHGSTEGIAQRIAARLATSVHVHLRPVEEADDVEPYEAVIIGSGVYGQRWIPSATEFVRRNRQALAARTVWVFSVGSFGDTHHVIGKLMRREPKEIGEIQDAIHPREYRIFAGAIERHQWPLGSRAFFHAFGGRFGDNRDWPEIDAWADAIARSLSRSRGRTSNSTT
ncbi:MAG TPA: flavodoxin domain-containing protein [Solirubrobacteraceae bacterium]|nr:flavodoxin domain-containing protein [Solirubrobacteraceae bacterium]